MTARAALWIGVYLLLVMVPLLVLLVGPMPPGVEFWWDFSMALGFAGMAMMGVQFALTARFKRASAPFGIDIIYAFHRYLAMVALGLVLAHFGILWLRYEEALGELDPRKAPWELTVARVALVSFVFAVITSEFRQQLRINYDLWRVSHVVLAIVGFAAAVAHIMGVGYYTEAPIKRVLWLSVTLFWVLLLVWVRVVKPWSQVRHPYRVAGVREERGDAWTLALEPDGHLGLSRFMPGQFGWLTLRRSPFGLREHPFSISSAPEQLPRLEFTIKALGDFTGTIRDVKAGEKVYLDAPYGIFTIDRFKDAHGFAFIVGSVGITPALSMLRSMAARGEQRPLWLFYANQDWESVIRREEIDALRERLNLKLIHVLEEPPEGWRGEEGLITGELLERHLPADERARLHYFLCGPPPMLSATEETLSALGVRPDQVRLEVFNLV